MDRKEKLITDYFAERSIGLIEYVNTNPGFKAILKERYSDFIVNEIDWSGHVIELTDSTIPIINPNENEEILGFIEKCEYMTTEIENHLIIMNQQKNIDDIFKINVTNYDKSIRTMIHKYIRNYFKELRSKTEDQNNEKYIIIFHKKNKEMESNNQQNDNRNIPKYLHFVLYKEGIDTIHAVSKISRLLGIKSSRFSYAGTKDKRALTTQRMSVFKVEAKKLAGINKINIIIPKPSINELPEAYDNLEKTNVGSEVIKGSLKVGNFKYSQTSINLGQLSGNLFNLKLRNLNFSPYTSDSLSFLFDSLSQNGFINYFGHQRFGTNGDTWKIGKLLLSNKFSEALNALLDPDKDVKMIPELRQFIKDWRSRNLGLGKKKIGNDKIIDISLNLEVVRKDDQNIDSSCYSSIISGIEIAEQPASYNNAIKVQKDIHIGCKIGQDKTFVDSSDTNGKVGEEKNVSQHSLSVEEFDIEDKAKIFTGQINTDLNSFKIESLNQPFSQWESLNDNKNQEETTKDHHPTFVPKKIADSLEYKLIKALDLYGPKDPLKIFNTALHRNMRLLFVHAYQSYIWNKVVSEILCLRRKRIANLDGMDRCEYEIKVGDLVFKTVSEDEPAPTKKIKTDTPLSFKKDDNKNTFKTDSRTNNLKSRVIYVTDDNISQYSFKDIVLPLPGYEIFYPKSQDILDLYRKFMGADGLRYEHMKRKVPEFSLSGDYRRIIEFPKNLEWHYIRGESEVSDYIDLKFSLLASSYATMCIRELTKQTAQEMIHL
ncbi:unnamed protein product [Gordionus sp. m RMFG-2023]